jgi:hypothetical protein
MASNRKAFGDVLHRKIGFDKITYPPGIDANILLPGAESHFLSEELRRALGLPIARKPTMALGTLPCLYFTLVK